VWVAYNMNKLHNYEFKRIKNTVFV
jgi:hypothetical protein